MKAVRRRELSLAPGHGLILIPRPTEHVVPRTVRYIQLRLRRADSHHSVAVHGHAAYEILVPLHGTYRCTINGCGWQARPGEALVVRPGDMHADDSPGPLLLAALQLQVEPALIWTTAQRKLIWPIAHSRPLIDGLTYLDDDALGSETADAYARIALTYVLRHAGAPSADTGAATEDSLRQRCAEWLAGHLATPLDLSAWAHHLDLSRRTLSQRCRTWFGTSPARVLAGQRLAHARLLLSETQLPVKQVARRCGFPNPEHFATAYRKHFGVTPGTHAKKSVLEPMAFS